jgi:hypothetical protein
MSTLALELTRDRFHALSVQADKRKNAITVSRADLATLLRDHGRLIRALRDAGTDTTEKEK